MDGLLGGLVYLVGQLGLLLVVAAGCGAVLGRHIWAARRIRTLEDELRRTREQLRGPQPPQAGEAPPGRPAGL